MTKQGAADYLGVSVRTLENYVSKNRLSMAYLPGKTRSVTDFKKADLDRLKAELALPEHRPAVAEQGSTGGGQLARQSSAQETSLGRFAELRELAEVLRPAPPAPVSPLPPKLTLTVGEAVNYSGVGRSVIRAAIEADKLKSARLGLRGAWVVKRADLEAWVRKL